MGALTGQSIAASYEQLLHVDTDGGGNTTTLVPVKDGDNGTTFALQLSTTTAVIDNPTASSSTQGGILRLQSDDGAVMASGHRLGVIEFGGAEDTSSTITTGARIEAITDATWSASENGADMVFYTTDGNASQSEVLRLTADNLVGIGTSSPGSVLYVASSDGYVINERFTGADGAAPGFVLRKSRGSSAGSLTTVVNGDSVGDIYFAAADGDSWHNTAHIGCVVEDGSVTNNQIGGKLKFRTSSTSGNMTEHMTIDNAGDVTVATGDIIMGTSGKGISFAATSDATGMSSEVLDDYEEGTWTPVFAGSGGTSGQSYSIQVGVYTKVGNLVTASCYATLTDKGTITTTLQLSGFPFTSSSTSNVHASAALARVENWTLDADHVLCLHMNNNGTAGTFTQYEPKGSSDSATVLTTSHVNDNTSLMCTMTYRV